MSQFQGPAVVIDRSFTLMAPYYPVKVFMQDNGCIANITKTTNETKPFKANVLKAYLDVRSKENYEPMGLTQHANAFKILTELMKLQSKYQCPFLCVIVSLLDMKEQFWYREIPMKI